MPKLCKLTWAIEQSDPGSLICVRRAPPATIGVEHIEGVESPDSPAIPDSFGATVITPPERVPLAKCRKSRVSASAPPGFLDRHSAGVGKEWGEVPALLRAARVAGAGVGKVEEGAG
eukprot:8449596-Pyramimonas_sp.AAC.1